MKRILCIVFIVVLLVGGVTAGVMAYNSRNTEPQTQVEEVVDELPAEDYNDDIPAEDIDLATDAE